MKLIILVCFCLFVSSQGLRLINENVYLDVESADNAMNIILGIGDQEKLYAQIGQGLNLHLDENCNEASSCSVQQDDVTLSIESTDSGFEISWTSENLDIEFQDCVDFKSSDTSWYGGPERWYADWPVQTNEREKRPYITSREDSNGLAERYWLNSKGAYIHINDEVPLHVDENVLKEDNLCLFGAAVEPYVNRDVVTLIYSLVAKEDPKEAHLHAVNNKFGKPIEHPSEWIIRNPIWTTWAKYKKNINDEIVKGFGDDIASHGFTGQIEIDDYWETCYGTLTFNDEQFSDINNTVKTLHDVGFTVSLWVHPFVNNNCQDTSQYGQDNNLFVKSNDGSDVTNWWDGDPAHYIDFTKEEARNWFEDRLKHLQELHGIDTFKFDAGESDYAPPNPVFEEESSTNLSPNYLTSAYVRTCATFGGGIEVRVGYKTQDLPIFKRMLDKDSRWGLDNGLQALITSLLVFNINGYVFVLPDMIGGNGYNEQPTAELIARWTQANTFMPTMQFSYLPWDIPSDDFDGVAIIKKFVALHEEYADTIIRVMEDSIANGTPVNPPIWWVDPTNPDALKSNDQFLLGEEILVAPIVEEGATSRNIVIPSGIWKDGNNDNNYYIGPIILMDYDAPIDVLPYFIKQ